MKKTCTLIVAAYAPVRAGLAALLRATETICVQGELPDGGDTLSRMLPGLTPDAILYDTGGSAEGIERLLRAIGRMPEPPALIVLGEAPRRDLPVLKAAECLSGWAYLSRDAEAETLALAITAAASGLTVQERRWSTAPVTSDEEVLTPREIEVIALMAQGLPNKIIAFRLGVTLHTAKFHVAQILAKLGAASRTEAVTLGARRGLVAL